MGGSSRFGGSGGNLASLMEQSDNYSDGYDRYGYRGEAAAREAGARVDERAPRLQALLVAALFPQVVMVEEVAKSKNNKKNKGGTTLKFRAREEDGAAPVDIALHPSCVASKAKGIHGDRANNGKGGLGSNFLVYHERVKTTRVYVRDATPVPPLAMLLFGGRALSVSATNGSSNGGNGGNNRRQQQSREVEVMVDDWMPFKLQREQHEMIVGLRQALDRVLRRKVEEPQLDFSEGARDIIEIVIAILDSGGRLGSPGGGGAQRGNPQSFPPPLSLERGGRW